METARSSETSVDIYLATRRYIPEEIKMGHTEMNIAIFIRIQVSFLLLYSIFLPNAGERYTVCFLGLIFDPEKGGNALLRNVSIFLPDCNA
jgi:hypothetical protein